MIGEDFRAGVPINAGDDSPRPVFLTRPIRQKPILIQSKVSRRVRAAVTDAGARQEANVSASANALTSTNGRVRLDDSGKLAVGYTIPASLRPTTVSNEENQLPVIRALPRRQQAKADELGTFTRPQMHLEPEPKTSLFRTLRRLGVWIGAFRYFTFGNMGDKIRRRDSVERRAVRLRQTFERVGGTFVKIGQQMASRLDLLPLRYCEELSAMLDHYPPFPTEQAVAIIEQAAGKKLGEIFSTFDPDPIGSASIACVYQAVLRDSGEKVAVKVRRPNIRALFESDFRIMDLFGELAEGLSLIPPGMSLSIREEFRTVLTSELDFRREARIQEIFERQARKAKIRFFSAPKVYSEFSNEEVIVQEFVSGMWMYEVLAGVELSDPVALARMAELNIEPKKLASRLLFMNNWGVFESLAFHADPHPANIVVRANSELVFIDFGATGYFDQPRRDIYMRMQQNYQTENIWEMAKMGVAISEPLPAVDVNLVTRDLQRNYYSHILAMKSKNAPWYERTTANTWINSLKIISRPAHVRPLLPALRHPGGAPGPQHQLL
jgi:predicted unusual protein kinase regulating ubiquinone biosynthesis (AarF/ABC1/UbiB family)